METIEWEHPKYKSLLEAIKAKDKKAIKEFEQAAKVDGQSICLM